MGATLIVHPLDLLKNRMQLSGLTGKKESRSTLHVFKRIITNEGFFAIYGGLSAGLLRQATYTTTRLGIYTWLFDTLTRLVSFYYEVIREPNFNVSLFPNTLTSSIL